MTSKESQPVESATQPHLARPSLLTDLVPGFIPEIHITEQPGQDADVQGPGTPGASWGIGVAPRSVTPSDMLDIIPNRSLVTPLTAALFNYACSNEQS